ncbi:MAG: chloride channel protein [Parvularculaceae bacterium]
MAIEKSGATGWAWISRARRRFARLAPAAVWFFAVAIGAAGAYAVIGFRAAIDFISVLAFGETEEAIVSAASSLGGWRAAMGPILGGCAVSGVLYAADRFGWLKGGRGQGVADVIEARAVGDGRISLRTGLAAATVSALSVGAGASAGREGPAAHLGATIASTMDERFGFTAKDRRTLLGCGAAAAVAASFNAPIAGVLFALEVIMGNYALSVFGPIAAASVTGAVVARTHLGNFPAFAAPEYGAVGNLDVPLSALLGLLCGLLASLFLRATQAPTVSVREIADARGVPYVFLPPIGGAIVGAIAAFHPEVLGVSYEAVTNALAGGYTMRTLIIIAALKLVATAVTVSFRFGGGVFSPGLVIGAFAGAAFGAAVQGIAPEATASPALYAMVGMGAAAGAILGAPISTTLIVFELTGDYALTISLLVSVAIATFVTQGIVGRSYFQWQLSRRGYDMSDGPQGVILQTIRVREVMEKMPAGAPLSADAPRLATHQSLGAALAELERADEAGLPVVSNRKPDEIVGYLSRVKALGAYNRALIDSHIEHHR